jgi:hypothetical protein
MVEATRTSLIVVRPRFLFVCVVPINNRPQIPGTKYPVLITNILILRMILTYVYIAQQPNCDSFGLFNELTRFK